MSSTEENFEQTINKNEANDFSDIPLYNPYVEALLREIYQKILATIDTNQSKNSLFKNLKLNLDEFNSYLKQTDDPINCNKKENKIMLASIELVNDIMKFHQYSNRLNQMSLHSNDKKTIEITYSKIEKIYKKISKDIQLTTFPKLDCIAINSLIDSYAKLKHFKKTKNTYTTLMSRFAQTKPMEVSDQVKLKVALSLFEQLMVYADFELNQTTPQIINSESNLITQALQTIVLLPHKEPYLSIISVARKWASARQQIYFYLKSFIDLNVPSPCLNSLETFNQNKLIVNRLEKTIIHINGHDVIFDFPLYSQQDKLLINELEYKFGAITPVAYEQSSFYYKNLTELNLRLKRQQAVELIINTLQVLKYQPQSITSSLCGCYTTDLNSVREQAAWKIASRHLMNIRNICEEYDQFEFAMKVVEDILNPSTLEKMFNKDPYFESVFADQLRLNLIQQYSEILTKTNFSKPTYQEYPYQFIARVAQKFKEISVNFWGADCPIKSETPLLKQ